MAIIRRRELIVGAGALTLAHAASLVHACPACAKTPGRIKKVLCATKGAFGLEFDDLLRSSGDAVLDRSLTQELIKQSDFFGFRPGFAIYTGGDKNAAATTEVLPQIPGTDGTILYNLELMQEQLKVSKWGGAILAGVIAHEFGHIFQSFTNAMGRLGALGDIGKFIELHADFLSGFYMGGKDRAIDLKPYTEAFFGMGDTNFDDRDHHGTQQERYFAIKAGYNHRRANPAHSVSAASRQGEAVLKEYIH